MPYMHNINHVNTHVCMYTLIHSPVNMPSTQQVCHFRIHCNTSSNDNRVYKYLIKMIQKYLYSPSSVISILISTSGTLFLMAEKNTVCVWVSSVSVIPQATGIPDNHLSYSCTDIN